MPLNLERLETLNKSAHVLQSAVLSSVAKATATFAVWCLGVYGFSAAYAARGEAHGVGNYAYRALQLVVGQFPAELAESQNLPLSLQIARWTLPLITLWATISIAWRQSRNPFRAALVRARGEHLVVAGDAGLAAHVGLAERKARRPVMVWADQPPPAWVHLLADHGAPHVISKTPGGFASKLGLAKARVVLAAGPDGATNVTLVSSAVDAALEQRSDGDPLTVIARIDDPDLRGPLERRFNWSGERSVVRVRLASLPDILAREMFLKLPLDRFQHGDAREPCVFILGFSPALEDYVRRLLAAAHFRGGGRPRLVALDPNADRKRDVFYARRPGAANLAPVAFETAPVTQAALIGPAFEKAVAAHGAPTAIFVDPDDPNVTLSVALAVEEVFAKKGQPAPPIYTRLAEHIADGDLACEVIPVGGIEHLADPELLLQERLDSLARSVHEFYLEGRLEEGDQIGSRISMFPWDQLPEAVRDDNRLLTDCYELKLRDIGARLVPGADQGSGFRFRDDELEALSHAEHDRWMAAKLIDGWVHGEKRDDAAKIHPDIIPYEALTDARQELDREQIRIITRLATNSGKRVVRDLTLVLDTPAPKLSASALDAIAAQYPDRALVVVGAFEEEAARAALLVAETWGAFVALTLAGPPEDSLARIARVERAKLRKLYRKADRIHAFDPAWTTDQRRAFVRGLGDLRLSSARDGGPDTPVVTLDGQGAVIAAPWTR